LTSICIPSFIYLIAISTVVIYTLSLHDALPIFCVLSSSSDCDVKISVMYVPSLYFHLRVCMKCPMFQFCFLKYFRRGRCVISSRSEEHTSELQSRFDIVCRLLLEKKKK